MDGKIPKFPFKNYLKSLIGSSDGLGDGPSLPRQSIDPDGHTLPEPKLFALSVTIWAMVHHWLDGASVLTVALHQKLDLLL